MIRALLQLLRLLHLPTFVRGLGRDERGRSTPVHNGKFASFMSVQGNHRRHADRHDRRLRPLQVHARAALQPGALTGIHAAWKEDRWLTPPLADDGLVMAVLAAYDNDDDEDEEDVGRVELKDTLNYDSDEREGNELISLDSKPKKAVPKLRGPR